MLSRLQIRNEWRLIVNYPLFWVVMAGVAGFSLLIGNGSPAEPGSDATDALLRLNLFIPAFMLPFVAGALGPIVYLREVEHDMAELFAAYPLSLKDWLTARCGSFTLLLCSASLVAQMIFLAVLIPAYASDWREMAAYSALWLLVLHLPSCLLWASGLSWLACRRANSGFLYLAAGLGWLAYLGAAAFTGTPLISDSDTVWPLLKQAMFVVDPYAVTAMVNPMPQTGLLQFRWLNIGIGRLFWIAIAFTALAKVNQLPSLVRQKMDSSGSKVEPRKTRASGGKTVGHIRFHLRYFFRDPIFTLLVLGWFTLLLSEVYGGMDSAEPLSQISPDSRDALNRVVWDVLPVAGALLMLYAADRLCRLYPTTRMHELYAATPHAPRKLITVQLASLSMIALLFMLLAGLAVGIAQFLAQSPVQPREYLLQLGLSLNQLCLFAAAFTAIHGLVRPRFLANIACLLILVLSLSNLAPALSLHHPLWKPFNTPLTAPDHIWGFAGGLEGHFAYTLVWIPAALAALMLAVVAGNRTLSMAQVLLRSVASNPMLIGALIALGTSLWQGFAIDHRLREGNALATPEERIQKRADYERIYGDWEHVAQPDVDMIRTRIDIKSADNRADIRATIRLVNRSGRAITQILVGKGPMADGGQAMLGDAIVQRRDERLGQTVFKLRAPMKPGEKVELVFDLSITKSVLEPASFPLALRPEFSSVPLHALLPVIGFKRELTLRDPNARAEQGLPRLQRALPSRLTSAPRGALSRENTTLDAIVSTDSGQYAIAQGALLHQWETKGRSFFHYRTGQPIRNLPAFFSVPWRPQAFPVGPDKLLIYAPEHLRGDDPNVLAVRDTLTLLGNSVAPYAGDQLHFLAVPDAGPSGYALPQIIQISHRLGFRARPRSDAGFDQRYRRAAHETAHQWFGHLLGYGVIDERAFLVESLAKYAELVLIERRYGKKAMLALVEFERDRYRHARLNPDQPTAYLINAEESEDMYSRATLAFACLRSKIGDTAIFSVLRRMAADSQLNQRPVTSMNFLAGLKSAILPQQASTIDRLFLSSSPIELAEHSLGCAKSSG